MMSQPDNNDKIQTLYQSHKHAKPLFDWLATRPSDERETELKVAATEIAADYRELYGLFKHELQPLGLGDIIVGRKGQPTRFMWHGHYKDVVKDVAQADGERVLELPDDTANTVVPKYLSSPQPTMRSCSFPIRQGLEISFNLPIDLTQNEAERFGMFVKSMSIIDT